MNGVNIPKLSGIYWWKRFESSVATPVNVISDTEGKLRVGFCGIEYDYKIMPIVKDIGGIWGPKIRRWVG